MVDDDAAIPVVLLCASTDEAAVTAASIPLGSAAAIAVGLERDGTPLRDAASTARRPTLFVVCKTAALGAAALRRTVESFGSRSAAGHRLLVVELVPHRNAGFVATVKRARHQLGRARDPSAMFARCGMRDSSVVESVGGETHVDHAHARLEPPATLEPVGPATRDGVGPIPPHVRTPSPRPHLALVDAKEDVECESFVDLDQAERAAAATVVDGVRQRPDRARLRLVAAAAVAVAITAVLASAW